MAYDLAFINGWLTSRTQRVLVKDILLLLSNFWWVSCPWASYVSTINIDTNIAFSIISLQMIVFYNYRILRTTLSYNRT